MVIGILIVYHKSKNAHYQNLQLKITTTTFNRLHNEN